MLEFFRTLTYAIIVCCFVGQVAAERLILAGDGHAPVPIVVRAEAGVWERRAAEDLAYYMGRMTGIEIPLVDDDEATRLLLASDSPAVLVGRLALIALPALQTSLSSLVGPQPVLGSDGLVARRQGNRIYLAGSNDESHYYAVVELLDRWGCRWFLPTEFGECIPDHEKLTVDRLDVGYAPPFEVRKYWLSWNGDASGQQEFMMRNRMNQRRVPAGHALQHYVGDLVPEGKTIFDICLASEATADHIAAQVLDKFAAGESAVSLSMDDGVYMSDCPEDAALHGGIWDKYMQAPVLSDAFLSLYNNVARRTKDRFPKHLIGFLAYANITIPPQRGSKAEGPLVAYLAPIDICPIHGMDHATCTMRSEYRDMMYAWARTMEGRMIIYDYDQGMLVWRDIPNPSFQAFAQDVKHYRAAGILGIDTESRGAMATIFLNLYMRGRLMWNPDSDIDALLSDFYPRFFGPAAAAMTRYWTALYQAWQETSVHEHEFMLAPAVYTPQLLQIMRRELSQAEEIVAHLSDTDLFTQRVRFVRQSFSVTEKYITMVRAAATDANYGAAVVAGESGLAWRNQLASSNPTFTTTRLEQGPAWWPGEVEQYRQLRQYTEGPRGYLLRILPLEWSFRLDQGDRGVVQSWPLDSLEAWDTLRTDLYLEAQGVELSHGSWYQGYLWYRTQVELVAPEHSAPVHLRFPGLFGRAWLYVNGQLAAQRDWNSLYWRNDYSFEWDVDLRGLLQVGHNQLALRLHTVHPPTGIWRRPFLYTAAD